MLMHAEYYKLFNIKDFFMRLALPDLRKLDKYVDEPDKWLHALEIIKAAMTESGLPYVEAKGEAAFYGPKIDFIIRSAVGIEYAISTNQLDFLASERFGLSYVGEDGEEHAVYVIHRAPLGSHERFIAFLTEHYGGAFPFWLAPVQVVVVPISEKHIPCGRAMVDALQRERVFNGSLGLRVELDESNDRMQKKIRSATMRRIPVLLIVGDAEVEARAVSVRLRDGTDLGQIDAHDVISVLRDAAEQRNDGVLRDAWGT